MHTVTFRQARQFVPAVIPLVAATGLGGGPTTVVALVVGVTLLSLGTAALSWWRFSYADGPSVRRRHPGTARPLGAHRAQRPDPRRRGRDAGRCTGCSAWSGCASTRPPGAVVGQGRGARRRRRLPRRGRPAADRRPHPPAGARSRRTAPAPEPAEEEFARFDNRWLLYAPLVGSYLALPLAAVGALFRLAQELPESLRPDLDGRGARPAGCAPSSSVVGALLLLLVGSVVGAAVVNWGFRLVRRGGSLIAVRGLITRRHTELEIDRIRGCDGRRGRRACGWCGPPG